MNCQNLKKLEVNNVSKVYYLKKSGQNLIALKNVTFSVEENEFLSIVGHSGCGKTTLLNLVAGFDKPSEGEISIDGDQVTEPSWDKTIVFQEYALFPWYTILQNVEFGLEMKKISRKERLDIGNHFIDLVGLAGFRDSYPNELSGGMRQRVAIARALAVDPKILLMDEPFGSLDMQTRLQMQDELLKIWVRAKKTVMFVTHSIEEAVKLSDRTIILTCRPGTVKQIIPMRLDRPRVETDIEFIKMKENVKEIMQEVLLKGEQDR